MLTRLGVQGHSFHRENFFKRRNPTRTFKLMLAPSTRLVQMNAARILNASLSRKWKSSISEMKQRLYFKFEEMTENQARSIENLFWLIELIFGTDVLAAKVEFLIKFRVFLVGSRLVVTLLDKGNKRDRTLKS